MAMFILLFLSFLSFHTSFSSPLLEKALFKILPLEDQLEVMSPISVRLRRSLDDVFMDPIQNLTNITNPVFNLSTAESDFFRLPTAEFHKRIYNQFEKMQQKVFNESLVGIQDDLVKFNKTHFKPEHRVHFRHESGPNYETKEETYKIPSKDGVQIVRKGLRKYKDNMENWVEQTFVHKPKSIVQEEKIKIENATTETTDKKVSMEKIQELWGFERNFDTLMRKYQKEMTSEVFDRYNNLYENFMGYDDDFLFFPRSLMGLRQFMWQDHRCGHGGPCGNQTHV